MRLGPDGKAEEWFNTGGIPAGLAFGPDGALYVADEGDDIHGILRITPDKQRSVVVDSYQGRPLNGANDLVFDADGTLYFSDPWRSSRDNPIGGFYRLHPDDQLEQIDTGLAFPNGVAVDDEYAYLAETGHNRVLRYRKSAPRRAEWARLDGDQGPDGMALDAAGNLYVAHWGAAHVDVLRPDGSPLRQLPVPGRNVTNVAFRGTQLVVTEVESGAVYSTTVEVPGRPLVAGPAA